MLGGAAGQQGQGAQPGQQGGLGGLLGGLAGALGGQQGQAGQAGQAGGGGLGGLLGGLAGALGGQNQQTAQTGQEAAPGAQQCGLGGLLGQITGAGGGLGGLAAGGLLGMLAGRGGLGNVAKIGGIAALGYLAHNALKQYQAGQQGQAAPALSAPDPRKQLAEPASDGNPFAFTLVRAMISAAAADGHIDAAEQQAISAQLEKLDLGNDGAAIVQQALQNPAGAAEIANLAGGPEQGAQIYLMSRLAINPDHPAEKAYLEELSSTLGLPDDFIAQLEAQVQAVQAA